MCLGIRPETLDFRDSYEPLLSASPDFCPDPAAWFSHVHKASDWWPLSSPCQFSCHSVWRVNVSREPLCQVSLPFKSPFSQREPAPLLLDSALKEVSPKTCCHLRLWKASSSLWRASTGCKRKRLVRTGTGKISASAVIENIAKDVRGDFTYNVSHYKVACMLCLYVCIRT